MDRVTTGVIFTDFRQLVWMWSTFHCSCGTTACVYLI